MIRIFNKVMKIGVVISLVMAVLILVGTTQAQTADSDTFNGVIISDTIPSTMIAGHSYSAYVTVMNTGTITWVAGGGDSTFLDENHNSNLLTYVGWRQDNNDLDLPPGEIVYPGETYSFPITYTAHPTLDYTTGSEMAHLTFQLHRGQFHELLGGLYTKDVTVSQNFDGIIESNTIPDNMEAGKYYPVDITVRNTGDMPWFLTSDEQAFNVFIRGSSDNPQISYENTHTAMRQGEIVNPGESYTFSLNYTVSKSNDNSGNVNSHLTFELCRSGDWAIIDNNYRRDVTVSYSSTPKASFSCVPNSQFVGEPINFFTDGTTEGTYPIVDYLFDFGDGNFEDCPHRSVIGTHHSYLSPGTYAVTLTVRDSEGNSDSVTKTVTIVPKVIPCPPIDNGNDNKEIYKNDGDDKDKEPVPVIIDPSLIPGLPMPIPVTFPQPVPIGFMSGLLMPNDIVTHNIHVNQLVLKGVFYLKWPGSDLDLVLYTPNGTRIGPENNESGGIYYVKNTSLSYACYLIDNMSQGYWTAEVIARDVNPRGENYTLTLLDYSNVSISVSPSPSTVASNGTQCCTFLVIPLLLASIVCIRTWRSKGK